MDFTPPLCIGRLILLPFARKHGKLWRNWCVVVRRWRHVGYEWCIRVTIILNCSSLPQPCIISARCPRIPNWSYYRTPWWSSYLTSTSLTSITSWMPKLSITRHRNIRSMSCGSNSLRCCWQQKPQEPLIIGVHLSNFHRQRCQSSPIFCLMPSYTLHRQRRKSSTIICLEPSCTLWGPFLHLSVPWPHPPISHIAITQAMSQSQSCYQELICQQSQAADSCPVTPSIAREESLAP